MQGAGHGGLVANPQSTIRNLVMVDNAPILTHQHAGLTIEGYSRAAVQSYWRVPELKLGFDLGAVAVLEPAVRVGYLRAEEILDHRNRRRRWIGQRLLRRGEQYERGHGNESVCKTHQSLHL